MTDMVCGAAVYITGGTCFPKVDIKGCICRAQ